MSDPVSYFVTICAAPYSANSIALICCAQPCTNREYYEQFKTQLKQTKCLIGAAAPSDFHFQAPCINELYYYLLLLKGINCYK